MPTHTHSIRVWVTIPFSEILPVLSVHYLTEELIMELGRYDSRKISDAAIELAQRKIALSGAQVAVLAATYTSSDRYGAFDCMFVFAGSKPELEKIIGQGKTFEHTGNKLEYEPTKYERVKESALNLMRKMNIKDFSEEELHRVFKHTRNYSEYMAIVRREVTDGLTITSLHKQDRKRGLER